MWHTTCLVACSVYCVALALPSTPIPPSYTSLVITDGARVLRSEERGDIPRRGILRVVHQIWTIQASDADGAPPRDVRRSERIRIQLAPHAAAVSDISGRYRGEDISRTRAIATALVDAVTGIGEVQVRYRHIPNANSEKWHTVRLETTTGYVYAWRLDIAFRHEDPPHETVAEVDVTIGALR